MSNAIEVLKECGAFLEGHFLLSSGRHSGAYCQMAKLQQYPDKAAVVSFVVEGAHAHDLATLLDLEGVAVRSGQHCAHPLLQYYGVGATCRASLAFYHTHEEIERFVATLIKVRRLLG